MEATEPGQRIRVTALIGAIADEWTGEAAIEALGVGGPAHPGEGTRIWIDLVEPGSAAVGAIAERLGLHPLIAEDIAEGNQRSKIEVTDGLVHLVVFALETLDGPGGATVQTHEIDLVLGPGFLLSVRPAAWDLHAQSGHFRSGVEPLLRAGPDHLLWAVVDTVVDGYFPVADRLEDDIDALQDRVIERPDRAVLSRLFDLKRDLIEVRRAISPIREVLLQLTNRDLGLIDPPEVLYFRDVYDHTIRLTDELDTDRELVSATLDAYLSTVNNNLSAIMKRLTGVTVVLAGIGAIAGIFGMSEAGLAFAGGEAVGFWAVAAVTIVLALLAAWVLRRLDWI